MKHLEAWLEGSLQCPAAQCGRRGRIERSLTEDSSSLEPRQTVTTTSLAQPSEPQDGTVPASTRESLRDQFNVTRLEPVQETKSPLWGALDATKAFASQIRDLVCSERINLLLAVVPVGISVGLLVKSDPMVVFILNALSIIPLAVIISTATERLASRLGDTTGALLNVTVGNAAEMLIFFTALAKDQLRIVQASLLGSIFANALLVLGTANICGGLRFENQLYDRASGRLSVCFLDVGLVISIVPVGTFACIHKVNSDDMKATILDLSRGISIGLIILYLLYLLLQTMLQTIGSTSAGNSMHASRHSHLHMQVPQSASSFEGVSHPMPTRSTPRQSGLGRLFGSLASTLPKFDDHKSEIRDWIPNLGLASTLTKIRNILPAAHTDPHDSYYILHDLDETNLPESGMDGPQSSDDHINHKHRTPFSPNSLRRDSTQTPSVDARDNANLGSADQSQSLTPSTPEELHSPTSTFPQSPSSYSGPKLLGDPSSHNSEPLARLGPLPDRNITFETSGRKSPCDSEESVATHTTLPVAVVVLLVATGIASITTELAVDAVPTLVESWNISEVFLGFIVLPFVGNAAEHVTAAKMALKNRMVLAKNVAIESATQVVLFIIPSLVLFCWLRDRKLTLQFDHFEVGCMLFAGSVVSITIYRGDSGWKQGVVLHAFYLIFALCAVFYRGAGR